MTGGSYDREAVCIGDVGTVVWFGASFDSWIVKPKSYKGKSGVIDRVRLRSSPTYWEGDTNIVLGTI